MSTPTALHVRNNCLSVSVSVGVDVKEGQLSASRLSALALLQAILLWLDCKCLHIQSVVLGRLTAVHIVPPVTCQVFLREYSAVRAEEGMPTSAAAAVVHLTLCLEVGIKARILHIPAVKCSVRNLGVSRKVEVDCGRLFCFN